MKRYLSLILAFVMLFGLFSVFTFAVDSDKDLTGKIVILHTSDVHGRFEDYAKVAQLKKDFENRGADVFLVDTGDFTQGSVYTNESKGENAVKLMNLAGYDVVTLGNHEFDFGFEQLKKNMEKKTFELVCSNIFKDGKLLETVKSNIVIKAKSGLKIGFFGLETPGTATKVNPNYVKEFDFLSGEEMYECARNQIKELKEKDADVIICLSHLGTNEEDAGERSSDLYDNVQGIDFILDGHAHLVFEDLDGKPIQAVGSYINNVGSLIIDAATGKTESSKIIPIWHTDKETRKTVYDYEKEDPETAKAANEIIKAIDEEYAQIFAKSDVFVNGDAAQNRTGETTMGNLVTDALLWKILQEPDEIKVAPDHVVAVFNGGGIRNSVQKGDISKLNIKQAIPFNNTLNIVYVKGSNLLKALEDSTKAAPDPAGSFPQISGMKISVDLTKSADRLEILSVFGNTDKPAKFNPEDTYAVLTNEFVAAGGGEYIPLTDTVIPTVDTGLFVDAVTAEYITEKLNGVIGEKYANTEGRIILKTASTGDSSEYYVLAFASLTSLFAAFALIRKKKLAA